MPTKMQTLEAALAAMDAPRAPKARPDITKARGYSPALDAIYSPRDSVNFLADSLEASGVPIVRTDYGFRTMNAAEREAADLEAALATLRLECAA